MSDQRFYEENDAEEILRLASRESVTGGMSHERLLETAAELGITPEAVERAKEQLEKKRQADRIEEEENALRKEFRQSRRRSFWGDVAGYFGTTATLVAVWFMAGQGYFWPGWVMAFWGIHLISEIFETFGRNDEAKFRRWQRRRSRKMGMKEMMLRAEPILDEYFAHEGADEKFGAIKELRDRLQVDLRDAKDLVDSYVADDKKSGVTIGVRIGKETPKRVD